MVVNGWLMDGYYNIIYLVGGFNQPLWKMMEFVSWDYDIPKPPTRSSWMYKPWWNRSPFSNTSIHWFTHLRCGRTHGGNPRRTWHRTDRQIASFVDQISNHPSDLWLIYALYLSWNMLYCFTVSVGSIPLVASSPGLLLQKCHLSLSSSRSQRGFGHSCSCSDGCSAPVTKCKRLKNLARLENWGTVGLGVWWKSWKMVKHGEID